MKTKNKPSAPKRRTLAEEVADIERLSDEEINAELARHSIDPEPGIKKVKAMVQDKLTEWRRGLLHGKKEVVHAGGGDD